MLREELLTQLQNVSKEFYSNCITIPDEQFFRQPTTKWSIAQNVKHLITSAKMTRLAYRLPKLIIRLYTGKPNRPSRSFDELVAKYKSKLEQGGKASGPYIPKAIDANTGDPDSHRRLREKWLDKFSGSMDQLGNDIQKKWKDEQLDQYLAPHPLLGKITLRELIYFTIYHTTHHLAIIRERLKD